MMIRAFLRNLMPDREFYETTSFWIWDSATLAAITGLVLYFIRKKRRGMNGNSH